MSPRLVAAVLASLGLLSCRDELHPVDRKPVAPLVASPEAIPEAPLNGTIRGARFAIRDARYIVDRRPGYAHTDIRLSNGAAKDPCGPVEPATSSSVWLRLEGDAKVTTQNLKVEIGAPGPWSVHYQAREADGWLGSAEATAVLSIREPGPDGRLGGGLAVCFSDDAKSCVSGTFDAVACPPTIDQPVRGTPPPEAVPEKYAQKLRQVVPASSGSSAAPAPSASTPPAAQPAH